MSSSASSGTVIPLARVSPTGKLMLDTVGVVVFVRVTDT